MSAPRFRPYDDFNDDELGDMPQLFGGTLDDVPFESTMAKRPRVRRGGPRTPLPLLPIIGIAAGIAIAIVAQTTHVTESAYQASDLMQQDGQLRNQDQQLLDQLDQLQSAERIQSGAQQIGMKLPTDWNYANQSTTAIVIPPAPQTTTSASDPVQNFVSAMTGTTSGVEAASR